MESQPNSFSEILQSELPFRPWETLATRRLPGIQPLGDAPYFWQDEVFQQQLAYRKWLLEHRTNDVLREPSRDIFEAVRDDFLRHLRSTDGYRFHRDQIIRPDGIVCQPPQTLQQLAQLIQEDVLIHEKIAEEHVLTSGVLCFPASWRFAEKLDRPLSAIHDTVDEYDTRIQKGVQRMLDLLRPGAPIWRANFLLYTQAELHQPYKHEGFGEYLRVERQILNKIPDPEVVVFTIHSFVIRADPEMRHSVALYKSE
ncbi:MAG: heme-dependent oxidative N-demethylase subunit alpha family protein [Pseudomonadota bacterium]